MLKLDEPSRNQEIFIIFFLSLDLGFERKIFSFSFWLIFFCPLDPDPWICMVLRIRIRIQEAKILRIQSTVLINAADKFVLIIPNQIFSKYRLHSPEFFVSHC